MAEETHLWLRGGGGDDSAVAGPSSPPPSPSRSLLGLEGKGSNATLWYVSIAVLSVFPFYMGYCQFMFHRYANDRVMRKRSVLQVRIASTVPGWLAFLNLIFSLNIGVPCGLFYVFALVIAPLSIGPQLVRAIKLWSMLQLSHLLMQQDVINMSGRSMTNIVKKRQTTAGQVPLDVNSAVQSAIKVSETKKLTANLIFFSTWGLVVFPTVTLLIISLSTSDPSSLSEANFPSCFPEPVIFRFLSPAVGLLVAVLAIIACFLLREAKDELGLRAEIVRNVLTWTITYLVIIGLKIFNLGSLQPLLITLQQMALSYSMIIMPIHHSTSIFVCWHPLSKVHPMAGADGADGGGSPNNGEYSSRELSAQESGGSSSGRFTTSSGGRGGGSARERSMAHYVNGLEEVLSTEKGLKKFKEHCAREFSVENIMFWQAINLYRVGDSLLLAEQAKVIYDEYVAPGSSMQVNLPNSMAKEIKSKLDQGNITNQLFDDGQNEIFNLMARDSYSRFVKSLVSIEEAKRKKEKRSFSPKQTTAVKSIQSTS